MKKKQDFFAPDPGAALMRARNRLDRPSHFAYRGVIREREHFSASSDRTWCTKGFPFSSTSVTSRHSQYNAATRSCTLREFNGVFFIFLGVDFHRGERPFRFFIRMGEKTPAQIVQKGVRLILLHFWHLCYMSVAH